MIHSAIGEIEKIRGKEYVHTIPDQVGFALFGPYETLTPGNYAVAFDIRIPEERRPLVKDDAICAYVEVTAMNGAQVLARRPLFAKKLKGKGAKQILDFTVQGTPSLEYRVYSTGVSELLIAGDRPVSASQRGQSGTAFFAGDNQVRSPFVEQHIARFRDLIDKGADVRPTKKGAVVSLFGVNFDVSNYDDFQMINEILIGNTYRFFPKHDVCVLDVGMNAGLASLYFATMPRVKKIYGFEPFPAPYARAVQHLRLNPDLAGKISPLNFGLGLKNEELTVLYDSEHTIDASIKGAKAGAPTPISIRNAAEVVTEFAEAARRSDAELVVKLDCEGSEFPIFDCLDQAGLIGLPLLYMIEWHKGWSASKDQSYLIEKLNRNGFSVFDHTNPFDPYAGLLFAAR